MRPIYKTAILVAVVVLSAACARSDDSTSQTSTALQPDNRGTFERAGAKVDEKVAEIKEKSSEIANKAVEEAHVVQQKVVEKVDDAHGWVKDQVGTSTTPVPTP